ADDDIENEHRQILRPTRVGVELRSELVREAKCAEIAKHDRSERGDLPGKPFDQPKEGRAADDGEPDGVVRLHCKFAARRPSGKARSEVERATEENRQTEAEPDARCSRAAGDPSGSIGANADLGEDQSAMLANGQSGTQNRKLVTAGPGE